MRIKANMIGFWKKKKAWEFSQEVLEEGEEILYENPERGWYEIYTFPVEEKIDPQELKWSLHEQETLALVLLDLQKFREKPLDEQALYNIKTILYFFASHKKDVILRPVYDREGKGLEAEPESFELVLTHLIQIGEVLEKEKHSVLVFQGFLVGSWGEMHTSAYLTEEHIRQMWDMLKIHTTDKIRVAVRTPAQWRTLIPEEKFQKREWKALGLFDDGIFGSTTHLGTFGTMMREAVGWEKPWSRKEELEFIEQISRDFPCGGEAIAEADPDRADQILTKDAKAVISEMQKMHLAYLNLVHDTRILDQWKAQSCGKDGIWSGKTLYEYVSAHLGYRFVLKKVEMQVPKRDKIKFVFEVENCGFASLFQEAQLFLIQENEKERKEMLLSEEVQKWHGGSTYKVETETGAMKGNIFLQIRRKKDGKIISFANKNSADRLLIGSLHSV